jgi:hypothetical protein
MRALGTTIEIDRREPLSRFEYYLQLSDTLSNCPDPSGHLRELADSFGHDVLNLATLAARLLWYEGVVPTTRRAHELVAVSVDSEAYFVMLQTACDIMADVVSTLGGVARSTPFESFHKLNQWAQRNPGRVNPGFQFLVGRHAWFDQVNGIRTKLVHRGGDSWIYTDRARFHWDIMLPRKKVKLGTYLLSLLQRLTGCALEFSKILAETVMPRRKLQELPKKTVISGAYVPALRHLLEKYTVPPKRRGQLKLNAKLLDTCKDYVDAACLGYPDGFWWQFLLRLGETLRAEPSLDPTSRPSSEAVFDCKFIFTSDEGTYGVVACDEIKAATKWLEGAAESCDKFSMAHALSCTVLVGKIQDATPPSFLPGDKVAVIVDSDPYRAAERAFASLEVRHRLTK